MIQQLGIILGIIGFVICIATALALAFYASRKEPRRLKDHAERSDR